MTDSNIADLQSPASMAFEFLGRWQDFAESLGMRSDFAAGGACTPENMVASLFPALGMSREYQEIGQRMVEINARFQRRCAEFAQQGADIGQGAWRAYQKRTSEGGPKLAPDALYDAWIDSAEEAYAEAAGSEAFARLLGDLCNLLSAFKVERGKLLEAFARQVDWPSRAEVDSLHRRVMALTEAAKKVPPKPRRKTRRPAKRAPR